jgi:hypothetical protein
MPFTKGKSGNPKGRKRGAKSKICESFYKDWLAAYSDPRIGGVEGLIKFASANQHNLAIFFGWGAKTMPSNLHVGNTADTDGKMQALLIKVIHTKDGDGGGNGDGAK